MTSKISAGPTGEASGPHSQSELHRRAGAGPAPDSGAMRGTEAAPETAMTNPEQVETPDAAALIRAGIEHAEGAGDIHANIPVWALHDLLSRAAIEAIRPLPCSELVGSPSYGFKQHDVRTGYDHNRCGKCGWVSVDAQHRRGTAAQHDEWFPSMDAFQHFKRTGVRAWVGGSPCDDPQVLSDTKGSAVNG